MSKYSTESIFKKSKEILEADIFVFTTEDLCAELLIAKSTFYEYIPVDKYESNVLKGMMDTNKRKHVKKLKRTWSESDSAALQMGFMKLVASNEERKKLCTSYIETSDSETTKPISPFNFSDVKSENEHNLEEEE